MIIPVRPSGDGERALIPDGSPLFKDFLQCFFLVTSYFPWEQGGTGFSNNLVNRFIDECRCTRIDIFHCVIPADDIYQVIGRFGNGAVSVSYTHLRAHETDSYLVCRLLLEKKKK